MINQSIMNGWTGIFPVKNSGFRNKTEEVNIKTEEVNIKTEEEIRRKYDFSL